MVRGNSHGFLELRWEPGGVFSSYNGDVLETFVYSYIRLLLKCLWKVGIPLE